MYLEKAFRSVSYAAVFCGFLALWISGTFGVTATVLFVTAVITAWFLEDARWQLSEKLGTALIVLALPFFYLGWRYQLIDLYGAETAVAGVLARMILSLTAIKLLQKKSDRDWIFIYLMSFFEVLLAAGLSISPLYVAIFLVYILLMIGGIVAFEIRKTGVVVRSTLAAGKAPLPAALPPRRLPGASIALLLLIAGLAVPLFFMLPRVGGAGFGGAQAGLLTSAGFSDVVKLGGIGRIQQSDEVVMRVGIEGQPREGGLYFRGVALDTFDGKAWSKSMGSVKDPYVKGDRDLIQLDARGTRSGTIIQTIYLEPMDTSVIFAIPRAVAIQGNFPIIERDAYGSLTYRRSFERISYTVLSDQNLPAATALRQDNDAYTAEMRNYLQLPGVQDRRIFELAYSITSRERNRYDKARALERYLQNNFGYTLEQRAGGSEPLADFLFNVREGHCEYFATAMAVMLRTQGVATRIVNGFHGGEYNDASDMTVVRQRNAHSWVEVYFPRENVWVPFDPTPASGDTGAGSTGISAQISKYMEAIEAFWIQHFVAYDNQGQRSLLRSARNGIVDWQQDISEYFAHSKAVFQEWWADLRGSNGSAASLSAIGSAAIYLVGAGSILALLGWLLRKIVKSKVWRRLRDRSYDAPKQSAIQFYERMQAILADKGFVRSEHQTPLEFAYATGIANAVAITQRYQKVRFGRYELSDGEAREVNDLIDQIAEV